MRSPTCLQQSKRLTKLPFADPDHGQKSVQVTYLLEIAAFQYVLTFQLGESAATCSMALR